MGLEQLINKHVTYLHGTIDRVTIEHMMRAAFLEGAKAMKATSIDKINRLMDEFSFSYADLVEVIDPLSLLPKESDAV